MINITNIYGTVAHPTPIGLSWVAQVHGPPQHGGGPSHNPASAPISEREEGELPDTDIAPAPSSEREEGEMSEDESSSVTGFMGPGSDSKPDRGPRGLGMVMGGALTSTDQARNRTTLFLLAPQPSNSAKASGITLTGK